MIRHNAIVLGTLLGGLAPTVDAGLPTHVGPEFRVNTTTVGDQAHPAVAMADDGAFVVVWGGSKGGGSGTGVFLRRYDRFGRPAGEQVRANQTTVGDQRHPDVAMDAVGNFTVIWAAADGSDMGIWARRYGSDGIAAGDEFRVNAFTTSTQERPAIAMNRAGAFVVAWDSQDQDGSGRGVLARTFAADGEPTQGSDIAVTQFATTLADQQQPDVALNADGAFVVAWVTYDGGDADVWYQRFDATGAANALPHRASRKASGVQDHPAVVVDGPKGFRIAWDGRGGDLDDQGIFVSHIGNDGSPVQEEIVNATTPGDQSAPDLVIDPRFHLTVTWQSGSGQDGDGSGIFAQTPARTEIQVNERTARNQQAPRIAADAAGNRVIVWTSAGQDGAGSGIFAQRIGFPPQLAVVPDLNGNGSADQAVVIGTRAHLKDGATGAPLGSFEFAREGGAWGLRAAATLVVIPDLDGANTPALAASGPSLEYPYKEAQIRSVPDGALRREFGVAGFVGLTLVPNAFGSEAPEIAALGGSIGGTSADFTPCDRVIVYDALVDNVRAYDVPFCRPGFVTLAAPPFAAPRIANLGDNSNVLHDEVRVHVRDAKNTSFVRTLAFFEPGYTAATLVGLDDQNGNGQQEVAVLGRRLADGAWKVQVRDSGTEALLKTIAIRPGYEAVADLVVLDDLGNDGHQDLAILAVEGGKPVVEIRDSASGALVRTIAFNGGKSTAEGIAASPDVDGNGRQDIVLLRAGPAGVRTEVRDAATGALVVTTSYP